MRHLYSNQLTILLFLAFTILWQQDSSAQNEGNRSYYFSRDEIGVNVTSVLANVLSFNANNAVSPYGIFYRRRFDRTFLRIGLDIGTEGSSETVIDPNLGTIEERELRNDLYNLRIGLERNIQIGKDFQFFAGIDLFGNFEKEHSTRNQNFVSDDIQYMGGIGPAIRLEYRLGKRLYLSTESTLYFGYGQQLNDVYINGAIFSSSTDHIYRLKLTLPMVLFISVQL